MQGLANICVVLSAVFWLAADFPLSAEVVSLAPVADTTLFVEYTPTLPVTNWQVWTNFSSSATATNFVVRDSSNTLPRFYRVKAE